MGVKSAFVNRRLKEDIYVCLCVTTRRIHNPKQERVSFQIKKTIYGFKQSSHE